MSSIKPLIEQTQMSNRSIEINFAIACYDGLPHPGSAAHSAPLQKDIDLKAIAVDSGNSDDSIAYTAEMAQLDPGMVLLQTPGIMGPAHAQN